MTRHESFRRSRDDRLLDEVEMAMDDYGLIVVNACLAWGYSHRLAWAAAAAARDGVLETIEAEERRLRQIAAREANTELARQRWRERQRARGDE